MKREPCILLQWIDNDKVGGHTSGLLIEQLRYCGLVSVVKQTENLTNTTYILEIPAPRGVDKRVWADQNALRMKSFGLNAAASWKEIR